MLISKSLLPVPLSGLESAAAAASAGIAPLYLGGMVLLVFQFKTQVARNQWHTPKYVLDRADVEGRQHCMRPLVQHGNALLLHTAVWRQADWFKSAEEYHI
jgi:hypothetical protein